MAGKAKQEEAQEDTPAPFGMFMAQDDVNALIDAVAAGNEAGNRRPIILNFNVTQSPAQMLVRFINGIEDEGTDEQRLDLRVSLINAHDLRETNPGPTYDHREPGTSEIVPVMTSLIYFRDDRPEMPVAGSPEFIMYAVQQAHKNGAVDADPFAYDEGVTDESPADETTTDTPAVEATGTGPDAGITDEATQPTPEPVVAPVEAEVKRPQPSRGGTADARPSAGSKPVGRPVAGGSPARRTGTQGR